VPKTAFVPCSFFERDPLVCARELIGTELVWGKCSGLIVETEAYLTLNDEACHTFTRPSTRAFVERNKPGAIYIYFNYGVHWMLNLLVKGGERSGLILIRAVWTMCAASVPVLASSPRRSILPIAITRRAFARARGAAYCPVRYPMWTSSPIRASALAARRIFPGALPWPAAHSLAGPSA